MKQCFLTYKSMYILKVCSIHYTLKLEKKYTKVKKNFFRTNEMEQKIFSFFFRELQLITVLRLI